MRREIKRMIVLTVGFILILLGLFGLVLPLLQGVVFLIVGLLLVSICFPRVRFWMRRYTSRNQHTSAVMNKMEKWLTKIIGEI